MPAASQQLAAKQALSILRLCGLGPQSGSQAVHQVLDAYLRSYGRRTTPPTTAIHELLTEFNGQRPTGDLYDWLAETSKG